jgi:hypothetical protein
LGNPAKARSKLGWKHKIGFQELVREMILNDLKLASERFETGMPISAKIRKSKERRGRKRVSKMSA